MFSILVESQPAGMSLGSWPLFPPAARCTKFESTTILEKGETVGVREAKRKESVCSQKETDNHVVYVPPTTLECLVELLLFCLTGLGGVRLSSHYLFM